MHLRESGQVLQVGRAVEGGQQEAFKPSVGERLEDFARARGALVKGPPHHGVHTVRRQRGTELMGHAAQAALGAISRAGVT